MIQMKFFSFLLLGLSLLAADEHFFQAPYLQLGNRAQSTSGALDLMWLGHDRDIAFKVEYEVGNQWHEAPVTNLRRVAFGMTPAHRVYRAPLDKLKPGASFNYRLTVDGKQVFASTGTARKPAGADTHFVVFGDCAADTPGQRQIAYYSAQQKPDFVFITGDIVYSRGRVEEYQQKFFPIYNAPEASLTTGAPLLRSTLFVGVVGNHDAQPTIDLKVNTDPMAYYLYWNQPHNGPALAVDGPNVPAFINDQAGLKAAYLAAAKANYPHAANFSFDYGNTHWTVLDSNPYVDWTTPALRDWVLNDLKSSKAKWRIVALHHPPFNSSVAHAKDQRIRVLSDIFEQGKADLVLAGHVHNYQRTHPLTFKVQPGFTLGKQSEVPGTWTLDKSFDGEKSTRPRGPIYIVTGAGGANLYNTEQTGKPETWQEFTEKFHSTTHSFTVIDTTAKELKVRQISSEGKEIDHFTITR